MDRLLSSMSFSKKEPIFKRNFQGTLRAKEYYSLQKILNDNEIAKYETPRLKKIY